MEKIPISEVKYQQKEVTYWKFQIGYHNLKGLDNFLNLIEKYEKGEKHKIRKICLT